MPNWVENSLKIQGPKTKVVALLNTIKAEQDNPSGGVCSAILPMPEHISTGGGGGETFMPEWYRWRTNNWGTKWDFGPIDEPVLEDIDDDTAAIHMEFDTAWAPPTKIYDVLVNRGFNVTAEYHEPGMGYVGAYEDGFDETYEYTDSSAATVTKDVPEMLVNKYGLVEVLEGYENEEEEDELD